MLRVLIGFVLVLALGLPVQAQGGGAACAAIDDDQERLECYDAVFRNGGGVSGESVVLESQRPIPARPAGRGPATMIVACVDGQVVVSFGFAGQLVSNVGDFAAVTFQVDQAATAVRTLSASADNTLLSFAPGRESEAFLDSLDSGTNLRVRMTPVRQRSVTVVFSLPGSADDIADLRARCS